MTDVTIVYWRDMPAQVIVGKGRRGVKRPLPERFEQAIDRAAMKSGWQEQMNICPSGARPIPFKSKEHQKTRQKQPPFGLRQSTIKSASRR